jgi:hypothetical protein
VWLGGGKATFSAVLGQRHGEVRGGVGYVQCRGLGSSHGEHPQPPPHSMKRGFFGGGGR